MPDDELFKEAILHGFGLATLIYSSIAVFGNVRRWLKG